ncbi:COX assembly mitochondrial protein homolog isoform X3 [Tupaia chinensis]|uniref:COX assembly mitochondrial protein homolog isoform X3 n=1 Tax=Tupaia chinensis TaxID=246437 RepID=UPI000FFCB4B5|nr:COX assembly mitochondrial protein homolog isoform X3 [Tupaia chinensis]
MALDPAEQHLRHVEKDVLIPKIMREKARERCSEQVQDSNSPAHVFKSQQLHHFNIMKTITQSKDISALGYRFYQMLQGLWNPDGSKMPERKFCVEGMSHCLL